MCMSRLLLMLRTCVSERRNSRCLMETSPRWAVCMRVHVGSNAVGRSGMCYNMLCHVITHPEVAGVRALACCLLAQASLLPKWHLKMWDGISAVAAQMGTSRGCILWR
jgi:hypothetical protein